MKSLCGDIGIAPISMVHFNDCRSSIKWVEYSALKVATVATDFGPYKRDMEHGKTGLLCKTQEDWNKALSFLIENETMRRQLGENAYNLCRYKFNLDFLVDEWMKVLNPPSVAAGV
jgi:glycosyltransferase involved in cell wall biosynthesis